MTYTKQIEELINTYNKQGKDITTAKAELDIDEKNVTVTVYQPWKPMLGYSTGVFNISNIKGIQRFLNEKMADSAEFIEHKTTHYKIQNKAFETLAEARKYAEDYVNATGIILAIESTKRKVTHVYN